MDLIIEREDLWAASVEDRPGATADKLAILAESGADLDFILARRTADRPGSGVLFVTPLRGDVEVEAASQIGFSVTNRLHCVRVEGNSERGIAATLAARLGKAGINLRGLSGSVIGTRFTLHLALDSEEDAQKSMQILQQACR